MNNGRNGTSLGFISSFDGVKPLSGFYIFRALKSLNPMVIEAINSQGRLLPKLERGKLKDITRGTKRSEVPDLKVRRGKQEFRVIRRWFAKKTVLHLVDELVF